MAKRSKSNGGHHFVCLGCERDRSGRRRKMGERCFKRGHLKTPWTWRQYGNRWRCLPCQYESRKTLHPGVARYGEDRCYKRGHLKTPETWKVTGTRGRCLLCVYASRDARRRARLEQAS